MKEKLPQSNQTILTGIRPTNTLTIANLIGAAFPILELQKDKTNSEILVFVATLHGLTDHESEELSMSDIVKDYLALGLDPQRVAIFDQLDIRKEVALMTLYLERMISVNRVSRLPTLKEKLKAGETPGQANMLLLAYPIMMAADILLQDADLVPVGKDQYSHMEIARELADAVNLKYGKGETIVTRPDTLNRDEPVNILSLVGEGKMSKSKSEGAIFLTDEPSEIARKMKKAETAREGVMTPKIESMVMIVRMLAPSREVEIKQLISRHLRGEKVMGAFKNLVAEVIIDFTREFQEKRKAITDEKVATVLQNGYLTAVSNATRVLSRLEKAMDIIN